MTTCKFPEILVEAVDGESLWCDESDWETVEQQMMAIYDDDCEVDFNIKKWDFVQRTDDGNAIYESNGWYRKFAPKDGDYYFPIDNPFVP